jgi:hypothetical protein
MNWLLLITAMIAMESGGILQIRQPYLTDVNKIAGTGYTLEQVAKSPTLSKWATITYIRHYGKRYTRITGKPLTYEVAARIHNGGLNGWKRKSTDAHWNKVRRYLENMQ